MASLGGVDDRVHPNLGLHYPIKTTFNQSITLLHKQRDCKEAFRQLGAGEISNLNIFVEEDLVLQAKQRTATAISDTKKMGGTMLDQFNAGLNMAVASSFIPTGIGSQRKDKGKQEEADPGDIRLFND